MPSTQWMAARVLAFALYYSGGLWVFERLDRRPGSAPRCMVVNYHRVTSEPVGYRDISVSPATFRSHLEYMLGRGYRFLSLAQYQSYLLGESTLEGDSVLLTFDDGYRDNYEEAFPILKELGVPAAVFLCTGSIQSTMSLWWDRVASVVRSLRRDGAHCIGVGEGVPDQALAMLHRSLTGNERQASSAIAGLIDWLKGLPPAQREQTIALFETLAPQASEESPMLTWEMVREMHSAGIAFGAHSVTHPVFSELTPEAARFEILESRRCIEQQLGAEITAFAYPYGKWGYFDTSTADALRACGIEWAYTTENGLNTPESDPYTLRRNGLREMPRYFLAVRLAGVFEHPALARLRSRIEVRRSIRVAGRDHAR